MFCKKGKLIHTWCYLVYAYTLQFDIEEEMVKQKATYNFWRRGRPEKLDGIVPVSLLFDKSLHKSQQIKQ